MGSSEKLWRKVLLLSLFWNWTCASGQRHSCCLLKLYVFFFLSQIHSCHFQGLCVLPFSFNLFVVFPYLPVFISKREDWPLGPRYHSHCWIYSLYGKGEAASLPSSFNPFFLGAKFWCFHNKNGRTPLCFVEYALFPNHRWDIKSTIEWVTISTIPFVLSYLITLF